MRIAVLALAAAALTWAQPGGDPCAQAVEFHKAGNVASAIPQYEACLTARPDAVEMRSNYGAALAHEGRYGEAIVQYQKALAAAPDNHQLRYNLVLAFYKRGDIAKAIGALKPLHSTAPDNMQVNLLLADCYLRLGELQPVIDLLGPLEAQHREDPGFAYLLGTALIRSGQVQRGQAVVDRILRDANSPESHFLIGSAAFANQDFPQAVSEFSKTVQLNPGIPSAWSFYGQSLLYTGDAEGADAAFRKELAANPNDYEANVKLGAILSARGRYREALPFLEHARMVRPDSAEAKAEFARAELGSRGIRQPAAKDETGLLAIGTLAPAFSLPALNGKAPVQPAGPVVLVFGSYTCPKFRFGAPALNSLYDRYHSRLRFVMVYIHEAHGGGDWQSTINQRQGVDLPPAKTLAEKQQYAASCARKLTIAYPLAVDGLDRRVEQAYHAWPSAAYVIGSGGRIAYATRLGELDFHPADMEQAIRKAIEK